MALDLAREKARGDAKIGTTGRGIGPAYEDKVARRGLRVGDLFHRERFAAKLGEILDYHNFALQHYYKEPAIDFQKTLDEAMVYADQLKPMMDVPKQLVAPIAKGQKIGTVKVMLDGKVIAQRPLVAINAVEQGGFFKRLWDEFWMWWGE